MCGMSDAKLRDKEVDMYFGYYGGSMEIGDVRLDFGDGKTYGENISKEEMRDILDGYSSTELAQLIVDLVENACEG